MIEIKLPSILKAILDKYDEMYLWIPTCKKQSSITDAANLAKAQISCFG
jgi:hypothetical protein